MDIRCDHKKHGEILDGIIEIKCRSVFCGAGSGVVVIHRWTLAGERLSDRRFADPVAARQEKGARL
jgi:hypothetical protein